VLKVSFYPGETEYGHSVVPLFHKATDSYFEKVAAAHLLPEVVRYIETLRPSQDACYNLVNAMGAGEFFGSNINGDYFTEASLIHRPDDWTGNPLIDKIKSKDWAYGFPTFYYAHPFAHHRNKDASRAFGEVELAVWNDRMKRVELVTRVDKDKCQQFGGTQVWDKLVAGMYPDVSMGCKVPFDTCSICLDWKMYREAMDTFMPGKHKSPGEAILHWHKTKHKIRGLSITRADYCDHAKKSMNKILPDGRKVWVFNDFPKFFDISFVFIGADRTAKTMMKIASAGSFWDVGSSVELAEKLGYAEDPEVKLASSRKPHAVIIKGNPKYISNNPDADSFYGDVKQHLEQLGYRVSFDAGKPFTSPPSADLWVGHSRGADRLRFAPEGTRTVALSVPGGVSHPEDNSQAIVGKPSVDHVPNKEHFTLTDEMRAALSGTTPKTASTPLSRRLERMQERLSTDDVLAAAFGKAAKAKRSEMVKDIIPSQFSGKAIPALTATEPDLPKDILDTLGKVPVETALSTTGGLGIVLRPREFQRVVLVSVGKGGLADELESHGTVFSESDEKAPMDLGPGHFLGPLARLLIPFFSQRSALSPAVEKRIIVISGGRPGKEKKSSSSHSSELLRKIGAAYNSYRGQLMDLVAHSQNFIGEVAYPFQADFRKLSSASPEEIFSPLSVAYIQSAFLDEVGPRRESGQNKLAFVAGVERGLPSRNT